MNMPAMKRELTIGYEEALTRVTEALKSEGFGVLTEIDVQKTFEQKLNVDFRRYKILGACNPTLAHRALESSLDVGVLLPCNVVVYENDEGRAVISAVDPKAAIGAFGGADFMALADDVQEKLSRALEKIG